MVKVEVGKWYRNSRGEIAYVFGKRMRETGVEHPFYVETLERAFSVTPQGSYYGNSESWQDLVEALPDCDSFTWEPPKPPQYRDAVASDVTWPWSEVWVGDEYPYRKTYLAGMGYDAEGKPIYTTTDGKVNKVCKVKLP